MSSILKTNALESEAYTFSERLFLNLISQYCFFLEDSITLVRLAKAFFPAKIPFPLLHVDTGHNFLKQNLETDW
jgi:sulfate adenylyltransferase subunit 2